MGLRPTSSDRHGECSICLEDMNDPEVDLVRLPCQHLFHNDCIVTWVQTCFDSALGCCPCPICRWRVDLDFLPDSELNSGESDSGNYVNNDQEFEALLQRLADEGTPSRVSQSASNSAIEKLRTVEIKEEEEAMKMAACVVCQDEVVVGEIVKEMPCGHAFHGDCLLPWLSQNNSCPVCRFRLQTEDQNS